MKKVFIILCVCAVISACGGSSSSSGTDTAATASTAAPTVAATIDTNTPGGKLIAASDCLTCHKVDVKVIGPAYQDVAAKYPSTPANIDTLANKILKGGKGHWGDVPMAAHPNLSLADAKTIVTYILSLKK